MGIRKLLIKTFSEISDNLISIKATADLTLISFYCTNDELYTSFLKSRGKYAKICNVKEYVWQEDSYSEDTFYLLTVNRKYEITYYAVTSFAENNISLSELAKWNVHHLLQSFQELGKSFENISSIAILKFEAKEAVLLLDRKVVISFFPSCVEYPQITSVIDLQSYSPRYKKVVLSKDILFALDETGSILYIYSFFSNTKLHELKFSDYGLRNNQSNKVKDFTVSLLLDTFIFSTEDGAVYSVSLDIFGSSVQTSGAQGCSTVTAFTKNFPSLMVVNKHLRQYSTSSKSLQPLSFSCTFEDESLQDLLLLENKLCFLYSSKVQSVIGIHTLDSNKPTTFEKFPSQSYLVKSHMDTPFPVLLFQDHQLFLILFETEQDKLVNELMVYPSSGAVKELSSLNNWSNIHIDIEVLKLGLSNRQLYTVEFFLRTLFEGLSQLFVPPFSNERVSKIENECSLWKNTLELILENIRYNLADSFTCQYAEQLLQVVIGVVIQVIALVSRGGEERERLLPPFSDSLRRMRAFLLRGPGGEAAPAAARGGDSGRDSSRGRWKEWETLPDEDVMTSAILQGNIPLAQSYFFYHRKNKAGSCYSEFEKKAGNLVVDYLRQGSLEQAIVILKNMGVDVGPRLSLVFRTTAEGAVRRVVLGELATRRLLAEGDRRALRFAALLEKLHPCSSVAVARAACSARSQLVESSSCSVPPRDQGELEGGGGSSELSQDNLESGPYCRLVLDWILSWDSDTKGRILSPHYLRNCAGLEDWMESEGGLAVDRLIPVWCHLLEHGDLSCLQKWIDVWLGLHPGDSDEAPALGKWPLTFEMVDLIPERATLHVSETLLNTLARRGVFCRRDLDDTSLLLSRLGSARCDVGDPAVFDGEQASISFSRLCHRIVHRCLGQSAAHFLYSFVSRSCSRFETWPSCEDCDKPVVNLIKAFYLWSQNHTDADAAYAAASGLARHLLPLPGGGATPAEVLLHAPAPLALATLLLGLRPLRLAFDALGNLPGGGTLLVREKFRPHPLLFDCFFGGDARPDVSVYDLLRGSTVFDTSQLFGWQVSNKYKSEESQSEFPHFSLRGLSEQHGLRKELSHLYFLAEGRPNYSYMKFIAREVVLETGLSLARVRSACRDVTDYALSHYASPEVSAACVYFVELLGQNSLPLRACLAAARAMHRAPATGSTPEIARKFKLAFVNKDAAVSLVEEVEQLVLTQWDPHNTEPDALFKDIILWMPVMTLCHLYDVEAGNPYLNECAQQNNWLKFFVFSQIFQIPKEQVLKATPRFSNPCISYHIFHSLHRQTAPLFDVAHEAPPSSSLGAPSRKDMRKSLYSRIGVIRGAAPAPAAPPADAARKESFRGDDSMSVTSEETSTSSDSELRAYVMKDLFSQLLFAQSSDCPWNSLLHTSFEIRNPVLALLAASYPESRLENCFFTWLYTNLHRSSEIQKELDASFEDFSFTNLSTDDLENLISLAIRHGKISTLWQGTHLFLPDTPLPTLMGYLRSFMIYKKFDSSIESFQNQLWAYPKHSDKPSVLHSSHWIESTSARVLREAAIACSTSHERLVMLRHFHYTKLENSFSKEVPVPEFTKVHQMVQCLNDSPVSVRPLFLPPDDPAHTDACWRAVEQLLVAGRYDAARAFCSAARLPPEEGLVLQINYEVKEVRASQSWSSLSHRIKFWKSALLKLKVLSLHTAVEFLEVNCELSDKYGEKYFLMKFVVDTLKEHQKMGTPDAAAYDIEIYNKKMWLWCIKAQVNEELQSEIFDVKTIRDYDAQYVLSDMQLPATSLLCVEDDKDRIALEEIIGQFLQKKDLYKAFELASYFGFSSNDLEIVKMCLQLAKCDIDVTAASTVTVPDCAAELPSSRWIRSLLLWVNSGSSVILGTDKLVIQCMEKLSRKCTNAALLCHQILVQYTAAAVLGESFTCLSQKEVFSTLKNILVCKFNDEHILAKTLIVVNELEDNDVANFLSEEILVSLRTLSKSDLVMTPEERCAFSERVIYDPLRASEGFQLIVKLCQDPSLLGNRLVGSYAAECAPDAHRSCPSLCAGLLVCAHECFTAACHMFGISQILHEAHGLVNLLEETDDLPVMIRLFTGLGRYNEMVYVFDILKSRKKLDLLKKMRHVQPLKLALLDYLKRCSSSEDEQFVYDLAREFGMAREEAEVLEMSVQKTLSALCKKNTVLDYDTKKELEKALEMLTNAAKRYCEADCLHQAQSCSRLAQLVALQLYFLPAGIWIIGLDDASVARFITDHDKFHQAYIVAEEYGNHQLWSQALLRNVVLRGDREYLDDLERHLGLPTSLVADVVKRYQKTGGRSENGARHLKLLLSRCSNVRVKYGLARELGFSDVMSDLMMGDASGYLQDLMASCSL